MKHLKFLLAVVLAVCGMSTAKAEIVQNYGGCVKTPKKKLTKP